MTSHAIPPDHPLAPAASAAPLGDGASATSTADHDAAPARADGTERLLRALAQALHRRGLPAHRLEAVLHWIGRRLGTEVLVLATPTAVQLAFTRRGRQRVHLLREEPGSVDLARICALNDLVDDLGRRRVGVDQALARLAEIDAAPPAFGPAATVLAFAAASGSAALLFGGGAEDVATSTALGAMVGALSRVAGRFAALARVFEPLAAFGVVLAAAAVAGHVAISVDRVALSAIIALVPGFTLTVAMSELAVRHLASGVARLAGAAATFLAIGLGVGIGRRLAEHLPAAVGAAPPVVHGVAATAGALVVASLAFLVLFQARPRDVAWVTLAGAVAFAGARAGAVALGPELGGFVGALAVGLFANAVARSRGLPASVPQVPGIMLLVPGSLGFRAVSLFLMQDVLSGVEAVFRMLLVAVALVGGLLAANVVLPPRRDL